MRADPLMLRVLGVYGGDVLAPVEFIHIIHRVIHGGVRVL